MSIFCWPSPFIAVILRFPTFSSRFINSICLFYITIFLLIPVLLAKKPHHRILTRSLDIWYWLPIFVDFKQAYNSIERLKLYTLLLNYDVSPKHVRLMKKTMNDTICQLKVGGELTERFAAGIRIGTDVLELGS